MGANAHTYNYVGFRITKVWQFFSAFRWDFSSSTNYEIIRSEVIKAFACWSYLNHGMQSLSRVVSTADSAMPALFLLKENSTIMQLQNNTVRLHRYNVHN